MGGFGSGRTSKVGRRSRKRRLTTELFRIRSYELLKPAAMRILAEVEQSPPLCMRMGDVEVGKLVVSFNEMKLYRPGGDEPYSVVPIYQEVFGKYSAKRYSFNCPECDNRCINLYWDMSKLGCQRCHDLMHPTQNMSNEDRMFWKRNKYLKRHGLKFEDMQCGAKKQNMKYTVYHQHQDMWQKFDKMAQMIFIDRFSYTTATRMYLGKMYREDYNTAERCTSEFRSRLLGLRNE